MEYRNVIIIGPKNTGKSTIASRIVLCSDYPRQAKETTLRSAEKVLSDTQYRITVIDTTGFYASEASRERGNHLKEFLRSHNINIIHLIIFVIRAGRLTGEDRRNLESIAAIFRAPQLSGISALIITHCEQYNDKRKQDIIAQFKDEKYTSSIGNLMQRGILTTGFVAADDYDQRFLEDLRTDNKIDLENIDGIIAEAAHGVQTTLLFRLTLFQQFIKSCLIL